METLAILGAEYPAAVIPMIADARETLDIIIYEWRLVPQIKTHIVSIFTQAICDAVARGVAVRAIVAHDGLRDELRRLKIPARASYSGKLLHAKVILLDKKIAVIGSHNFTQSAFTQNVEVSVALQDPALCSRLSTYFDNMWGL
jgi:phosphatidylserine/phosphatidylglycerophosphate/cardiolipin synthase-like enzyme